MPGGVARPHECGAACVARDVCRSLDLNLCTRPVTYSPVEAARTVSPGVVPTQCILHSWHRSYMRAVGLGNGCQTCTISCIGRIADRGTISLDPKLVRCVCVARSVCHRLFFRCATQTHSHAQTQPNSLPSHFPRPLAGGRSRDRCMLGVWVAHPLPAKTFAIRGCHGWLHTYHKIYSPHLKKQDSPPSLPS